MKKITIICGSPHQNSHSDALAEAFAAGASAAGHAVEIIKLTKKNFEPCRGCDHCRNSGNWECILHDDMTEMLALIESSDVVAMATPLYFLTVSAQLKAFIDRFYCAHHAGRIRGKKGVLLTTSGGPGSPVLTDYFKALCGLLGWEDAGSVAQGGMPRAGEGLGDGKKAEAFGLGEMV